MTLSKPLSHGPREHFPDQRFLALADPVHDRVRRGEQPAEISVPVLDVDDHVIADLVDGDDAPNPEHETVFSLCGLFHFHTYPFEAPGCELHASQVPSASRVNNLTSSLVGISRPTRATKVRNHTHKSQILTGSAA